MSPAFRPTGFTMAELLVVLVILGLTSAIVTPAIVAPAEDQLAAAADDLVRALELARRSAAERALPVSVRLDPARGRVRSETVDGDNAVLLEDRVLRLGAARLDLQSGDGRLTFHSSGGATPASFRLSLGPATHVITVERWTGAPRRDQVK
jgi:general secretion pathway protein H